tara:strand:- start:220 stop:627 length:408 start_codon:yes stop_codon:yes gene_type:complete
MALDPISTAMELGNTIISRIFPDPAQAAQAKLELMKLQQSGDLATMTAQTDINKEEAKSSNIFVSGWRPFVGWICGSAFALHFLLLPVANFVMVATGGKEVVLAFDMQTLMTVLMGLLGLGGMRTFEKVQGVASK